MGLQSRTYVGFTLRAKNSSFNCSSNNLSIKTKRAIFALNNKIRLSQMPIKLALKGAVIYTSPPGAEGIVHLKGHLLGVRNIFT